MINYYDHEPHTATVKEHAQQITEVLRDFCQSNYDYLDYLTCSDVIKYIGKILDTLASYNLTDILTLQYHEWCGFNIIEKEA